MKTIICILFATLILSVSAHAGPRRQLTPELIHFMEESSAVTLYSIHPDRSAAHWFNHKFHYYRILGQIPVTASGDRQRIVATIREGIRDSRSGDSKCVFSPRHAVRFSSPLHTYDFLICYQCGEFDVLSGNQSVLSGNIGGSSIVFDRLLRAARIRIAD